MSLSLDALFSELCSNYTSCIHQIVKIEMPTLSHLTLLSLIQYKCSISSIEVGKPVGHDVCGLAYYAVGSFIK